MLRDFRELIQGRAHSDGVPQHEEGVAELNPEVVPLLEPVASLGEMGKHPDRFLEVSRGLVVSRECIGLCTGLAQVERAFSQSSPRTAW
jgi:hypothetical protein